MGEGVQSRITILILGAIFGWVSVVFIPELVRISARTKSVKIGWGNCTKSSSVIEMKIKGSRRDRYSLNLDKLTNPGNIKLE